MMDIQRLITDNLDSDSPTRAAELNLTLRQGFGFARPTRRVHVHRGINATKETVFQALQLLHQLPTRTTFTDTSALLTELRLWRMCPSISFAVIVSVPNTALLQPLVLDALIDLLTACPRLQLHVLQSFASPMHPLILPGVQTESWAWRNTTAHAPCEATAMVPHIASWLGINFVASTSSSAATVPRTERAIEATQHLHDPGLRMSTPAELAAAIGVEPDTLMVNSAGEVIGQIDWRYMKPQRTIGEILGVVTPVTTENPRCDGYTVPVAELPPEAAAASAKTLRPRLLRDMAEQAAKTAIYPGAGTGDYRARVYTALALAGEAGEVAGKASKWLRDAPMPVEAERTLTERLHAELGDTFWHWLMTCEEWGADPDAVVAAMFSRLKDRQARGVLGGSGDER